MRKHRQEGDRTLVISSLILTQSFSLILESLMTCGTWTRGQHDIRCEFGLCGQHPGKGKEYARC